MRIQTILPAAEAAIVSRAAEILAKYARTTDCLTSPAEVKAMFQARIAAADREVFAVAFLDAQHRLIELEELFAGTLTQTPVYPREVVRRALELNAAAVILGHNHPSGTVDPSRADEQLTHTIKASCAVLDIKVLDHIVVSTTGTCSFVEKGLL